MLLAESLPESNHSIGCAMLDDMEIPLCAACETSAHRVLHVIGAHFEHKLQAK